MRPQELEQLLSHASEAVVAAELAEATAQRMVRTPSGWDWRRDGAVCECGLLLTRLPRPVLLRRLVVTFGRPMPVDYRLTHVHIAGRDGWPLCVGCAAGRPGCPGGPAHLAVLCDTPTPRVCGACQQRPARPEQNRCRGCPP